MSNKNKKTPNVPNVMRHQVLYVYNSYKYTVYSIHSATVAILI